MIDIIKVKATNNTGKVALWERSTEQPNGEVFISGDGSVVEVANTVAVRNAIKAGELIEVQPEVAKAPIAPVESATPPVVEPDAPTISAAIRQEGSKTTKR